MLTSPLLGMRPVTPQSALGVRIDPPVSDDNAAGIMRAAKAMPDPLEDAPGQ